MEDAEAKYFGVETSVQVYWIGLKIRLSRMQNRESFWIGWGRRKTIGFVLKLEEQSEDDQGITSYLPVHTQDNVPMAGLLTIPSRFTFLQQQEQISSSHMSLCDRQLSRALVTCSSSYQEISQNSEYTFA